MQWRAPVAIYDQIAESVEARPSALTRSAVTNLGHHILLVLSAAALWAAGLRISSLAFSSGLLRVVAASVLAAAFAAVEAFLLGAAGAGLDALPLAAAAALTWIIAVRACPAPTTGVLAELVAWWRSSSRLPRVALGAGAGAAAAWIGYGLARPALGPDTLLYHLPVVVAFVQTGDPASMPRSWITCRSRRIRSCTSS
jgi:hypothetical protein